MKKCFAALLLVAAGVLPAAELPEAELFRAAVSKVDQGGLSLSYDNLRGLEPLMLYFVDAFEPNLKESGVEGLPETVRAFIKRLNLNAIQACATSSRTVAEGEYETKTFVYTGQETDGLLFDLAGRRNAPFRHLDKVPADAFLVAGGRLNPVPVWKAVSELLATSKDLRLSGFPQMADLMVQQALSMPLNDLLATLEGEAMLAAAVTTKEDGTFSIRVVLVLPDAQGKLAQIINTFLPAEALPRGANGEIPVQLPGGMKLDFVNPVLQIGDKCVTVALNAESLPAKDAPAFALKNLPAEGLAYFSFTLTKEKLDLVAALVRQTYGSHPMLTAAAGLPEIRLQTVRVREADGYRDTLRSSFPFNNRTLAEFYQKVMVASMLPALENARGKARQLNCVSNLKQLILSCILYAEDHDGKFPAASNAAGLELFRKDNYMIDMNVYVCPSSKIKPSAPSTPLTEETCAYFYIGGFNNKIENPSTTPILFDKPGNHSGATVAVAFADGHVETINLEETYTDPLQVIGFLNVRTPFPPEVLQQLKAPFERK